MKRLFAAALVLHFLSSLAFCFVPDLEEITDDGVVEATPDASPGAPADGPPPADATPEDAAPKTDEPAGQTLDDTTDKKQPPIDVTRHRPGACPEGPPCKEGD